MTKQDTSSLLRFIFNDEPETAVPADCSDGLHAYVELELAGGDADAKYPQMKACLESEPSFYELYEAVKEVSMLEQQEALVEPPETAVMNESFLESLLEQTSEANTTKQYKMHWQLNEVGHLIVQLTSTIIDAAQDGLEQLADSMRPKIQPGFILAGESRSSAEQPPQFSMGVAVEDYDVKITSEKMRANPMFCLLTVQVNIPSKGGWPNLADTMVTVRRGNTEIGNRVTDAYGTAVFKDIAVTDLDHLIFEIVPLT